MMNPIDPEEEAVSPRSDSGDSAQWYVVSPEVKPLEPRRLVLSAAAPGDEDEEERHLELHSVPDMHEAPVEQDADQEIDSHFVPNPEEAQADGSDESQKRWDQAEKLQEDIRRAGEASPPKMRSTRYFRILVAGAPATGKTTFIQNLSMSYGHSDDNDFSSPSFKRTLHSRLQHSPSTEEFLQSFSVDPTTLEDFVAWPSDLCTRVDLSDESAKTEYRIFIQDSPGFHNMGQETQSILNFLDAGNVTYMNHEQAQDRKRPMSEYEDSRVDVCLYFIAPHNLRPADIEMIHCIGQRVPVIPIIAKGDCMTKAELDDFHGEVSEKLRIGMPGSPIFKFDAEDLASAGLDESTRVFSVISSCIVDASLGRHWPVRSYPWGMAEALRSKHSDVLALKRLLFELSSFDSLKRRTDDRYYTFRSQKLADMVAATAAAAAAAASEELAEDNVESSEGTAAEVTDRLPRSSPRAQRSREGDTSVGTIATDVAVFVLFILMLVFMLNGMIAFFAPNHAWSAFPASSLSTAATNLTQAKDCLSALDLATLKAPEKGRHKELSALVALAEAAGNQMDPRLCPQERGALAFQAGMAKAELAAAERAQRGYKRLSDALREAMRAKVLRLRAAADGGAQRMRAAVRAAAQRMAAKLPVRGDGPGKMVVDVKALKRIVMRCGIMGLWF